MFELNLDVVATDVSGFCTSLVLQGLEEVRSLDRAIPFRLITCGLGCEVRDGAEGKGGLEMRLHS